MTIIIFFSLSVIKKIKKAIDSIEDSRDKKTNVKKIVQCMDFLIIMEI